MSNSNFVTRNLRISRSENTLKFLTYKKIYLTTFLLHLDTKIHVPRWHENIQGVPRGMCQTSEERSLC
jgi:hypothetical protein